MERVRLKSTTTKISKKQEAHTSAPQNTPALTLVQHILHLQRTVGNRAVGRLIQAKLAVSHPEDPYDCEADRMAEQVTSMPHPASTLTAQRQMMSEEKKKAQPPVQKKPLAESITPLAQRQMSPQEEKKEEKPVQPKSLLQRSAAEESVDAGHSIERQLGQTNGNGSLLPEAVRSYMESRFGTDFSGVRVHTGSKAQHLNRALNAQAFTVGQDIYYGASKSPTDLSLTAHELTHVAQQDGEQLQRPRTQTKEDAATGGAPSGRAKGPLNFLQPKPDSSADDKAKAKAEAAAKAKADKEAKAAAAAKAKAEQAAKAKRYKDLLAQNIGASGGGPFTDWDDYQKKAIKSGTFLGHSIGAGIRPEFQKMLNAAKPLIDKQYTDNKKTPPKDYGITSIGGFRDEISPHGAGVAIDIDGGKNPYVMHQKGTEAADKEIGPVYPRIAEFILNDPIDGEQSIIPKLIMTMKNLPKDATGGRADRLGQYWDRLKAESDAMIKYFELMKDEAALKAFLAADWKTKHPKATPPAYDGVVKQMWEDYRTLGGRIPKTAPASVADFKVKDIAGRPFDPFGQNAKGDPGIGFMTIPREVVVGLGQVVPRWGAIDFGPESGDIMHFDDRYGLGKSFWDAKAVADEKFPALEAQFQADKAKKEAAEAAKAGAGAGSGSATPTPGPQRLVDD